MVEIVAAASYRLTNLLFSILEMLILVTLLRKRRISRISPSKIVSSWSMFELVKALEEICDSLAIKSVLIGRRNMVEFFSSKNSSRKPGRTSAKLFQNSSSRGSNRRPGNSNVASGAYRACGSRTHNV